MHQLHLHCKGSSLLEQQQPMLCLAKQEHQGYCLNCSNLVQLCLAE
jgi:hypothetical protein